MAEKMFAIVYETETKIVRRVIDTDKDVDDAVLEKVRLAPDETLEKLAVNDFPDRMPAAVAAACGLEMPSKTEIFTPVIDESLPEEVRNAAKILSGKCKASFLARYNELAKGGFQIFPRDDATTREILSNGFIEAGLPEVAKNFGPYQIIAIRIALTRAKP